MTFYYLSLIVIVTSVFLICTKAAGDLYHEMKLESAFAAAVISVASAGTPQTADAMLKQAGEAVYLNLPDARIVNARAEIREDGFLLTMTMEVAGCERELSATYYDQYP